jgi:hypothetical protein
MLMNLRPWDMWSPDGKPRRRARPGHHRAVLKMDRASDGVSRVHPHHGIVAHPEKAIAMPTFATACRAQDTSCCGASTCGSGTIMTRLSPTRGCRSRQDVGQRAASRSPRAQFSLPRVGGDVRRAKTLAIDTIKISKRRCQSSRARLPGFYRRLHGLTRRGLYSLQAVE